jgi:hypothetical protein
MLDKWTSSVGPPNSKASSLVSEQLTELHHHKPAIETERPVMVDLTKSRARARAITAAINREGVPCPMYDRDSQNVAMVVPF